MLGRQRQPTKKESFFATMDVAAAALSHMKDGTAFPQHRIAFPHDILIYQQRFKSKDCISKLHSFKCIQASLQANSLLSMDLLNFILDAYEAYVKSEDNKKMAMCTPKMIVNYLTREQFSERLKHCFSFCHHFISYNPFHETLKKAYVACQKFYHDNWSNFQEKGKITKSMETTTLKTKFPAFKDYMMRQGTARWFTRQLNSIQHQYLSEERGDMGGLLFEPEYEDYVLDVMEGCLRHWQLDEFLPVAPSRDFLSSLQAWLRADANEDEKTQLAWLFKVELSEELYNEELRALAHEMDTWHEERMKRDAFLHAVLDVTPMYVTLHRLLWKEHLRQKLEQDKQNFRRVIRNRPRELRELFATDVVKAGELTWHGGVKDEDGKIRKWGTATWGQKPVKRARPNEDQEEISFKHELPSLLFAASHGDGTNDADESHPYVQQRMLWNSHWTEVNAKDDEAFQNRNRTYDGKWRLDGDAVKGTRDDHIRNDLWASLPIYRPKSKGDHIIPATVDGDNFIATGLGILHQIRATVEYLYQEGIYRAGCYNHPPNVNCGTDLTPLAMKVAIKFGLLRFEWGGDEMTGAADGEPAAIDLCNDSLRKWVPAFTLRTLNILLQAFYQCALQDDYEVRKAVEIFNGTYSPNGKVPQVPHEFAKRLVVKVSKEIYDEDGANMMLQEPMYRRHEVPVSETYWQVAPKPSPPTTFGTEMIRVKELPDHGYWDYSKRNKKHEKELNPEEAKRSAFLQNQYRKKQCKKQCRDICAKIGLDDSDSSEDEDFDDLVDGRWTFEQVWFQGWSHDPEARDDKAPEKNQDDEDGLESVTESVLLGSADGDDDFDT